MTKDRSIFKRITKLTLAMLAVLSISTVNAQKEDCYEFGADSAETIKMNSLMHEDVKYKSYASAREPFLYIFKNAPCYREQAYVDGIQIYEHFLKQEKDKERQAKYLDTLRMIYKQRIEYFGKEGYVKGVWGRSFIYKGGPELVEGMGLINESIALDGNAVEDNILIPYFQALVALHKNKKIEKDSILSTYEEFTEIIDYNIKNLKTKKNGLYKSRVSISNVKENTFEVDKPELVEEGNVFTFQANFSAPQYTVTNVDSIYVTVDKTIDEDVSKVYEVKEAWSVAQESLNALAAPYLDCESLVAIYTPKFEAEPENKELLEKILLFLNNARCSNTDFYFTVSEALLKLEPDPVAYRTLAGAYMKAKQYDKAMNTFEKAINLETDDQKKIDSYLNMARIAYSRGNMTQAVSLADKALAINPGEGKAYIIKGDAYARSAGSCKDKLAGSIYWVVVDQYIKAKAAEPGVAGAANRRIATYTPYFPTQEKGFFHSVNAGDSYTISCWPNLTTKARYNK